MLQTIPAACRGHTATTLATSTPCSVLSRPSQRSYLVLSRSKKVIGWKEIRWAPDLLNFMRELFPCAKFVINVRSDIQAQANSGWHHGSNAEVEKLKAMTNSIKNWVATHMMLSRCSVHCRVHIAAG